MTTELLLILTCTLTGNLSNTTWTTDTTKTKTTLYLMKGKYIKLDNRKYRYSFTKDKGTPQAYDAYVNVNNEADYLSIGTDVLTDVVVSDVEARTGKGYSCILENRIK